jgi:MFS family permease
MPELMRRFRGASAKASRVPRLWTSDVGASWQRVGRLVDVHNITQTVMVQLTGGVFLTGFALSLGAGPITIGILAALPLAMKVAQLVLSWWIERAGHWRASAITGAAAGRGALLLVPLLAVAGGHDSARISLLVVVLTVSALGNAVFELSFLTWMAELIPEPLRGVFWGKRGRNAGAVGIAASIVASLVLDRGSASAGASSIRFAMIFGAGAIVGCAGILVLWRLPRPRRQTSRAQPVNIVATLTAPTRDPNFRTFLVFSALWSFAAGYMAPFYMVHMLRNLGLSFLAVTMLTALTNTLMAATQTYWGRLGDHFGTKPVMRIGAYLIALTPLVWLLAAPGRIWPVVIVQVLSGIGWSAFHVSQSNLLLKLAPEEARPSYLGAFGAASGIAEAVAPLLCGAALAFAQMAAIPSFAAFRSMMVLQLLLFAAATAIPQWIHEPRGTAVGHLIRVMGRYRAMDASPPAALLFEQGYTHLARIADLIAREYPRDAEPA